MANAWVLSALWVGLALVELLAIWFRVSKALSEIVVGIVAQLIIGAFVGNGGLLSNTQWVRILPEQVRSYWRSWRTGSSDVIFLKPSGSLAERSRSHCASRGPHCTLNV